MYRLQFRQAKTGGNVIVELPMTLFALLIGLTFPLLDLGAVALRTYFVYTASRHACHSAAKAISFKKDSSASEPSAKTRARTAMHAVIDRVSGLKVSDADPKVIILQVDKVLHTTQRFSDPLQSVDVEKYSYFIEVTISGSVEALITYNGTFFGNIPGLTSPIKLTLTEREVAEYPQGLVD